ncbi:Myb/SANT-like DNA-binding domain [Popillia japonica]|uniref:Regulatory protein zeste n=1 Tax=Popillia japonica TaxID=7064 RepID=A0AAW1MDY0_POPJA
MKPNEKHWEIILSYLESHPGVAIGRVDGPNARQQLKKYWEELAVRLNSMGYESRSGEKWRKTWTDFKYNLKKKHSEIQQNMKATGGGGTNKFLNVFEERALQLIRNTFSLGVGEEEVGFSKNNVVVEELPLNHPGDSSQENEFIEESSPQLLNKSASEDHNYQRKRKHAELEDAYGETIGILKEIKNTLDSRLGSIAHSLNKLIELKK